MMTRIFIVLAIFGNFVLPNGAAAQSKSAFYAALASSSVKTIDAQIRQIETTASAADRQAYTGALEMRKAGLLTIPAKKLSTFKQGHKKLEAAIAAHPADAEYRFLRLMIQENAPKNLGYSKNISEDSKIIKAKFPSLPSETRQSIKTYSKRSRSLAGI